MSSLTDYGPARFEQELERRRKVAARKKARQRRAEVQEELDVTLDDEALADEEDRDRYAEGADLLGANEDSVDQAPEPDPDRLF